MATRKDARFGKRDQSRWAKRQEALRNRIIAKHRHLLIQTLERRNLLAHVPIELVPEQIPSQDASPPGITSPFESANSAASNTLQPVHAYRRIHGLKYHDYDGDAYHDQGEPGLAGVEFRAYHDSDQDGKLSQSEYDHGYAHRTYSDYDGSFWFDIDPNAHYVMVEVMQDGWHQSYPATADPANQIESNFVRIVSPSYADGVSAPAGSNRASARVVSNALSAQDVSVKNDRGLSDFVWLWGQFVDHDLVLTESTDPAENLDIQVPLGDPFFDPQGTGNKTLEFKRSLYDHSTGINTPREQVNHTTGILDGSMVYGADASVTNVLRTHQGGELRTSDGGLLPFDVSDPEEYLAGDERVNENIALTAMHTVWVREHNRNAQTIRQQDPTLNDEQIFQRARSIVVAEIQAITYNDWLPALLGNGAVGNYQGYNPAVDPSISNLFASAAYRFGHSMLSPTLLRLNPDQSQAVDGNISLRASYFAPGEIAASGIDTLLQGAAAQVAQEIDPLMVDDVRNFLFGEPGSGGLDLAALNIQRGRDHGMPDYNSVRTQLGLARADTFADITSNPELQSALASVYPTVDDIDVWVGAVAEDHVAGSSVGELVLAVLVDQFNRVRAGDAEWYQNVFTGQDLAQVEATTLSDVIERNTTVRNLQSNVFFADTSFKSNATATSPAPLNATSGPTAFATSMFTPITSEPSIHSPSVLDSGIYTGQEKLGDYRHAVTPNDPHAPDLYYFGNYRHERIHGYKFEDYDQDGVHDPNEPGLAGVQIRAYHDSDHNGKLSQSEYDYGYAYQTTTDYDGSFWFDISPHSYYVIVEVLQEGWYQSHPSDHYILEQNLHTSYEKLGHYGHTVTPHDSYGYGHVFYFGNYRHKQVHGYKFDDYDRDGVHDPNEPGLAGVQIRAYHDSDHNGKLSQSEFDYGYAYQTTTDYDGSFWFDISPHSYYVIVEVLQEGWYQSHPSDHYILEQNLHTSYENLGHYGHTVTPHDSYGYGHVFYFGNYRHKQVHGYKFDDYDQDGIHDPNEPGLAGVQIRAYHDSDHNGKLSQSEFDYGYAYQTTTDYDGSFWFDISPHSYYVIVEVLQEGWYQSHPSDHYILEQNLHTSYENLGHYGHTVTPHDSYGYGHVFYFGNYRHKRIHGYKFDDYDQDGVHDLNEPGLAGVQIRAYHDSDHNGKLSQSEFDYGYAYQTTTDYDGSFWFDISPHSYYVIVEVLQEGWYQSHPSDHYILEQNLHTSYEKLGHYGHTVTPHDSYGYGHVFYFGNYRHKRIHGYKFDDYDQDGVHDLNEPGLAGVQILRLSRLRSQWQAKSIGIRLRIRLSDDDRLRRFLLVRHQSAQLLRDRRGIAGRLVSVASFGSLHPGTEPAHELREARSLRPHRDAARQLRLRPRLLLWQLPPQAGSRLQVR